jgi:bla regulator protein blaR1
MRSARVSQLILTATIALVPVLAQSPTADWQAAAGGKLNFDVASVKKLPPDSVHPPNFPLDPGDSYIATGGRFSAGVSLPVYIVFAYKLALTQEQIQAMLAGLPKWVGTDRFEVEANADGKPTKDQMRLMMQSLLADRFQLKIHFESREMPVYALVLAQPGKLGPKLQPHDRRSTCDESATSMDALLRSPNLCYSIGTQGREPRTTSARNVPMAYLAQFLTTRGGEPSLGRPVVDRTGLDGRFDFTIEYAPETSGPPPGATVVSKGGGAPRSAPLPSSADAGTPPGGDKPPFLQALREQLGLKLESSRGPVRSPVIDHIESPSEN